MLPGLLLWSATTGLVTLVTGIANPTNIFSEKHLTLSNEQVVEYFWPKIDGEVERLFDAQKYDEALKVLNDAKKIPQMSWSTWSLWALQSKVAERAFAENPFVLEKPAFREALEKAGPDGDTALAFPERYRTYFITKDGADDKVAIYDHCHRDPWGYITATSVDRFAKVIEFCKEP